MKKILVVLAVIMLFSSMAFATETRIISLGVPSWLVLSDDNNITPYPGEITFFKNELVANSNGNNPNGFVNIGMDNLALGAFTTLYSGAINISSTGLANSFVRTISTVDAGSIYAPQKALGLMGGMSLGDIGLGLTLSYSSNARSSKDDYSGLSATNIAYPFSIANVSDMSSSLGIGLGASIKDLCDIGIMIGIPMVSNTGTLTNVSLNGQNIVRQTLAQETLKNTAGMDFSAGVRGSIAGLIAALNFSSMNITIKNNQKRDNNLNGNYTDPADVNNESSDTSSSTTIGGGIGANLSVGEKLTLFPGIGITSTSTQKTSKQTAINTSTVGSSTENDGTSLSLPLYIAAEGKLTDSLTARAGIQQVVLSSGSSKSITKITGGTTLNPALDLTNASTAPATTIYGFGVSVKVMDVIIDADLSLSIGYDSYISAKYTW